MKLLVIGGTHFLGPAIIRRALDAGHEVLVYHRGQYHSGLDPKVPHLHGSVLDVTDHAAAIRDIAPEAAIDTTQARADTVGSVIAVIKGTTRRYVLVSSADVYRGYGVLHGTEDGPVQAMPVDEDADLRTRPSFDQTETEDKLFAERAALGQQDVPATVVRAPAILGLGDPVRRVEQRVKALRESGEHVIISEKKAAWRFCYGYLDDVVDALLLCALDRRPEHRVYNVGYPQGISNLQMLATVARAIGWDGRIEAKGEGPDDARHNQELYVDSSRIRRELGYNEKVSLEEAVRRTVQGFSSPVIRHANDSDLPDLMALVFPGNSKRQVENRVREHKAGNRQMLVAGFDGRVVGTVSTGGSKHQMPDSLRLFALDVAEEYRNRGIGTALIRAVEAIAEGRGLSQVNLEVGIGNEGAIRLYKRLGYELVSAPVEDSWQVLLDDGSTITERDQVWVMVKRLSRV